MESCTSCRGASGRSALADDPSGHRHHHFSLPNMADMLRTFLIILLLACQTQCATKRRKFSLWLKEGNDLQRKLGMKYPIYLVDNGQHGKDFEANQNKWTWQTSPIQGNVDAYEFQWQAISRKVRYEIIVSSEFPHFLPTPKVEGVPMSGEVPQTLQNFSIHFPCNPDADEHHVMINMEFRFYKGVRRTVPLFGPGQTMLRLVRQCPRRRQQMTQVQHQPECERVCGLRRRQGRDIRQSLCSSDYIIRANVTSEYSPLDPGTGVMLAVERQYRGLKNGAKDEKKHFTESVAMPVSYHVSDCDCIKYLHRGEQYLFFTTLHDGRPVFTEHSLVAVYNRKARRVLKRLREMKTICRNGRFVPFGHLW
ncbi:uncharacterized protein LOC135805520 [Sycon ciliatum]|uniref:uncharacterized protein LOC135805520 n=1 Tax=Sycon ciliatum TaxID=27933 RepID=UPI0031F63A7E